MSWNKGKNAGPSQPSEDVSAVYPRVRPRGRGPSRHLIEHRDHHNSITAPLNAEDARDTPNVVFDQRPNCVSSRRIRR